MKRHIGTIIALLIIICFTRIPFATKCICKHDSVNFALGIREFDIARHQPHPPGYPVYIGLAKFLNLFIKDVNKDLIILSIIFSVGAVILIYLLGKEMFNYKCGLASAIFLIISPLFWAYGELALSYTADAFASVLLGYLSYKLLKGEKKYVWGLSIVLGLTGGIRQTLLFFFLPLWVRGLISLKSGRELIKQIFVLVITCLFWVVPLLILSGGFSGYSSSSYELYRGSVFTQLMALKTIAYAGCSSLWGLGASILALFVSIIKLNKVISPEKLKESLTFFIVWCGPAFLFNFMFYTGKPGHILVFFPCFILLSCIFVYNQWNIIEKVLVGSIVSVNCLLFFMARPLSAGERLMGMSTARIKNFANFWTLDCSNKGLRQKEKVKKTLDIVKEEFSPEKSVICSASGGHFQPYIPWRVAHYYLPEFSFLEIGDKAQIIELKPDIETIIWLIDESDLKKYKNIELNKKLGNASMAGIYFSSIKDTLTLGPTKFYRGE